MYLIKLLTQRTLSTIRVPDCIFQIAYLIVLLFKETNEMLLRLMFDRMLIAVHKYEPSSGSNTASVFRMDPPGLASLDEVSSRSGFSNPGAHR